MAFEIERQTNLLSNFPNVGRPGRRPGTRELVIGGTPYVAVYRVRKSNVEILRLLHGAQKWP
jgi:toxin ParE1/3/4